MNPTRVYVTVRIDQGGNFVQNGLSLSHEFQTAQPLTIEKTALLLQKFSELCRAIETGKEISLKVFP